MYRDLLPEARGRGFSDQKLESLIAQAIGQCPILLEGDSGWFADPSIKAGLLFNAYAQGEKQRFYGEILEITHLIRSAHRSYNFGPKEGYRRHSVANAFRGLMHDAGEDTFKQRTVARDELTFKLVMQCWHGDQDSAAAIEQDIRALTDSRDLTRLECFEEQRRRAGHRDTPETNYSAEAMVARFLEKLDTAEGDYICARTIPDIFTPEKIIRSSNLAQRGLYLAKEMSKAPSGEPHPIAGGGASPPRFTEPACAILHNASSNSRLTNNAHSEHDSSRRQEKAVFGALEPQSCAVYLFS
jgi:hypothetical protein